MQKKHFYIDKYRWQVDFFILDFCNEADKVIFSIGEYNIAQKIGKKINEFGINSGLTHSKGRQSIIVVGKSDSAEQFLNTLIHELHHLSVHIAKYYNLDPFGEETAYIMGDVVSILFDKIKPYICNCCRHDE